MPNLFYTYISNIYGFGLVGFYGISNHCRLFKCKIIFIILYLNILDFVWLGFIAYHPFVVMEYPTPTLSHVEWLVYIVSIVLYLSLVWELVGCLNIPCLSYSTSLIIKKIFILWTCWQFLSTQVRLCLIVSLSRTLLVILGQNPLYTYILVIYDLVLVGFHGISTIVGYLMPNPLHTNILYIYDFVNTLRRSHIWFG